MTPLRKFIYGVTAVFAVATLIQIPFAISLSNVFSNPDTVDTILKDSKAYDQFLPTVLDNASDTTSDPRAKELIADNEIQKIILDAFPPETIASSGDSILDGVYGWLQGETAQPEFRIDFTEQKNTLVKNLSQYIEQRAAALPECTIAQQQTLNFEKDVLSLPCRPIGIEPRQIATQFTNDVVSGLDFLNDPVLDSKRLLENSEAQNNLNEARDLPRLYEAIELNKWYLIGQAIVLLALLIFARRNRMAGVVVVAKLLLGVGIFLGILVLLQSFGAVRPENGNPVELVAFDALIIILDKLFEIIRWFSIGYFAVGFLILIVLHNRKNTDTQQITTNTADTVESPKSPKI